MPNISTSHDFDRLIDYLASLPKPAGLRSRRAHSIHIDHLTGVHKALERCGCEEPVVVAGLFHSVYGTEEFEGFCTPLSLRSQIQEIIGGAAERLAYLYCAVTKQSIAEAVASDKNESFKVWDRFFAQPLEVDPSEFESLLWLKLINVLDVQKRILKNPRKENLTDIFWWRLVAEKLGSAAVQEWSQVYGEYALQIPYGMKTRPPSFRQRFFRSGLKR